jgi:hypothetical protein
MSEVWEEVAEIARKIKASPKLGQHGLRRRKVIGGTCF